jgi:hypothetical protein
LKARLTSQAFIKSAPQGFHIASTSSADVDATVSTPHHAFIDWLLSSSVGAIAQTGERPARLSSILL